MAGRKRGSSRLRRSPRGTGGQAAPRESAMAAKNDKKPAGEDSGGLFCTSGRPFPCPHARMGIPDERGSLLPQGGRSPRSVLRGTGVRYAASVCFEDNRASSSPRIAPRTAANRTRIDPFGQPQCQAFAQGRQQGELAEAHEERMPRRHGGVGLHDALGTQKDQGTERDAPHADEVCRTTAESCLHTTTPAVPR